MFYATKIFIISLSFQRHCDFLIANQFAKEKGMLLFENFKFISL